MRVCVSASSLYLQLQKEGQRSCDKAERQNADINICLTCAAFSFANGSPLILQKQSSFRRSNASSYFRLLEKAQGLGAWVCVIVYLCVLLLDVSSNDPQTNLSHPFELCSAGCCRSGVPRLQPVEQIHHSFKDLKKCTHRHQIEHTRRPEETHYSLTVHGQGNVHYSVQ